MEILEQNQRVAPVYNRLLVGAINTYLNAEPEGLSPLDRRSWRETHPAIDTACMTDTEFLHASLEANRQPLNPMTLAREGLAKAGYVGVEDADEMAVARALRKEYLRIERLYIDNGIDPSPLKTAWEVVYMTEAYIAGYTRQIDRIAVNLLDATPKGASPYNGLDRWHNGLWVPDEDMHDRIQGFVAQATGVISLDQFFRDHSRHMKIGNHVDTSSFIGSNAFVTLQEDATVITYENAARIYGPVFGHILHKIASNEAHHKRAYRYVHLGLAREFPDDTVLATQKVSDEFDMPGREGIRDFTTKAQVMGYVGLLDPESTLASQRELIMSMQRVIDEGNLHTDAAKKAWDNLQDGKNPGQRKLRLLAHRVLSVRDKTASEPSQNGLRPLIFGWTVRNQPGLYISDPRFT